MQATGGSPPMAQLAGRRCLASVRTPLPRCGCRLASARPRWLTPRPTRPEQTLPAAPTEGAVRGADAAVILPLFLPPPLPPPPTPTPTPTPSGTPRSVLVAFPGHPHHHGRGRAAACRPLPGAAARPTDAAGAVLPSPPGAAHPLSTSANGQGGVRSPLPSHPPPPSLPPCPASMPGAGKPHNGLGPPKPTDAPWASPPPTRPPPCSAHLFLPYPTPPISQSRAVARVGTVVVQPWGGGVASRVGSAIK